MLVASIETKITSLGCKAQITSTAFVERLGHTEVATAANGITVLNHVVMHKPIVAILNVNMPSMDGFGVVIALKEKHVSTQ